MTALSKYEAHALVWERSTADDAFKRLDFLVPSKGGGTYWFYSKAVKTGPGKNVRLPAIEIAPDQILVEKGHISTHLRSGTSHAGLRLSRIRVIGMTQADLDAVPKGARSVTVTTALLQRADRALDGTPKDFEPDSENDKVVLEVIEKFLADPLAVAAAYSKDKTPAKREKAAPEVALPEGAVLPGARIPVLLSGGVQDYIARSLNGDLSDIQALRTAREQNLYALLYSLPGTGKTMAARAAFGEELLTVQCTGDTEAADFVGTYVPTEKAGEFLWVDGPLVVAMEEGRPLLVDEIALADPRALAVLLSAIDGRRELTITSNPSRGTVHAKDGFYVVAAFNPNVPGARMSEALLSRFLFQVEYTTDFDAMKKLGVSTTLVSAAKNLDHRRRNDEISASPQARELAAFQVTANIFGEKVALRNLIAATNEADRDTVVAALRTAFGVPDLDLLTTA